MTLSKVEELRKVEIGVEVLTKIRDRVKSRTRNATAAGTPHERSLQCDSGRRPNVIRDASVAAFAWATMRLSSGMAASLSGEVDCDWERCVLA